MNILATPALQRAVEARMTALGVIQADLERRGGPAQPTWGKINKAQGATIRNDSVEKLERVLRWPSGTAAAAASGREIDPQMGMDSELTDVLRALPDTALLEELLRRAQSRPAAATA